MKIKFGTDGWRAIIADEFTVENVAKVTCGVVSWLKRTDKNDLKVVLGHDCRFAGSLFAETVAKVLSINGIKVYMQNGFVSTPMVSYGVKHFNADLGIVITASHNPPMYNGYKLKGSYAGPLLEDDVKDIEAMIPNTVNNSYTNYDINVFIEKTLIEKVDLEDIYIANLYKNFDIELIRKSKFEFAFDAMFGSGQNVIRKLFPDITCLHCEENPGFNGIAPEPLHKNLYEFSEMIKLSEDIDCGLVVDGDADRIAMYDSKGNYIDSHHVQLILVHYLAKYKGLTGKVCTGASTTVKMEKLCDNYKLELQRVKIGFKHIAGIMLNENVLMGGEESGGIAVAGYIPERDGIWNGLLIWEFMSKYNKTIEEIIEEIYSITGSFGYERSDLRINESLKQEIVKNCEEDKYKSFGDYKVVRVEKIDGFKYFFNENEWLMIRASGTEPLLRTYAESYDNKNALKILEAAYRTIIKK